MNSDLVRHNRPVSTYLHPRVYEAIIGLALLFVVSAGAFFATTGGYAAYAVVVVAGFFSVVISVQLLIWLTWRRNRATDAAAWAEEEHAMSFRDWASSRFATQQSNFSGAEAAAQALLPIAAVAVGMLAIGIVFCIVSSSMT